MMHELTIRLTLVSPFLTGAGAPPLFGVDARMPRNVEQRPFIPGTLLRGVARDALIAICQRCGNKIPKVPGSGWSFLGDLFGRSSHLTRGADLREGRDDVGAGDGPRAGNLPQRGAITFTDLIAENAGQAGQTLTRITIDSGLGSAKEGHHQVIELPYPIGTEVTFTGAALVRAADGMSVETVRNALALAFEAVPAIGAHKSAGFGRIRWCRIVQVPARTVLPASIAEARNQLTGSLVFDAPFLVAAERVAPNVFAGAVTVPGAAIKGAIATAWGGEMMPSALSNFLSSAVFRAARPDLTARIEKGQVVIASAISTDPRPVAMPHSLAVYDTGERPRSDRKRMILHDAIIDANPRVYGNQPPIFEVDWKPIHRKAACHALLGEKIVPIELIEEVLERDVRTRTAIDSETGAAKYDESGGSLFVYDMVSPQRKSGGSTGVMWRFDIHAPDGIAPEIAQRLHGLQIVIGKSDAPARIFLQTGSAPVVTADLRRQGDRVTAVVKLETPALLTPIEKLRIAHGNPEPVYRAYFEKVFESINATLVSFFARQRLIGGWQAMRFPVTTGHYDPWVATDPGAVFLLSVDEADEARFKDKLEALLLSGLPEADDIAEPRWDHCPLARVNGFGQISLWRPIERKRLGDWFVDVES